MKGRGRSVAGTLRAWIGAGLFLLALPGVALADGEKICGGIAGLACGAGEFCDVPNGTCGAADQTGTCSPVPHACTREFMPVCGCDGKTYPNDCERRAAGVSKLADGECKG